MSRARVQIPASPPKRNAFCESKRRSFLQFFRELFAELYFFVVISHGFMLISISLDSNIVYEGVSSEPKNSFWNILLFIKSNRGFLGETFRYEKNTEQVYYLRRFWLLRSEFCGCTHCAASLAARDGCLSHCDDDCLWRAGA